MPTISQLNPAKRRKIIKIYLDAFVRQPVPCVTCGPDHCCGGCQAAQGYFRSSFGNDEAAFKAHFQAMKDKYGWTDELQDGDINQMYRHDWKSRDQGFFVAGKGCRIPYKERSATCVSYTCGKMNKEQRDAGARCARHLYLVGSPVY